jgi:hypothetical protein
MTEGPTRPISTADRGLDISRREVLPRREVLNTTAARQGVVGHNVRYVLIVSTFGAIVFLGIVLLGFFS